MSFAIRKDGLGWRAIDSEADINSDEVYSDSMPEIPAGDPHAEIKQQATIALSESDKAILRCYESAIPVPQDWIAYRKALRNIVSSGMSDPESLLPIAPEYPSGT
ncbi:hypothetical protein [Pseudomonas sp. IT-P171]|uniref:hypothetical protein n=1 Tax=Pseudomonas sp. IT-P171 TaxID=3026453 RepID=UPI0039DF5921